MTPKLSRRAMLVLSIAFAVAGTALLVVAVLAMTRDDVSPIRTPVSATPPDPLRTTVRTHSPVGRFERARCRERPYSAPNPTRWFHPRENFYPPGGTSPRKGDLDHLINNDDAVVVTYRPDASLAARKALRAWAATGIGVLVAPSRTHDPPPLEAFTATRRLTCDGIDLDRLTTFTDRHFSKPLRFRPHGERSE